MIDETTQDELNEYITLTCHYEGFNPIWRWMHVYPHKSNGYSKQRFLTLSEAYRAAEVVAESYGIEVAVHIWDIDSINVERTINEYTEKLVQS